MPASTRMLDEGSVMSSLRLWQPRGYVAPPTHHHDGDDNHHHHPIAIP